MVAVTHLKSPINPPQRRLSQLRIATGNSASRGASRRTTTTTTSERTMDFCICTLRRNHRHRSFSQYWIQSPKKNRLPWTSLWTWIDSPRRNRCHRPSLGMQMLTLKRKPRWTPASETMLRLASTVQVTFSSVCCGDPQNSTVDHYYQWLLVFVESLRSAHSYFVNNIGRQNGPSQDPFRQVLRDEIPLR